MEKELGVWGYDMSSVAIANARKQGISNARSAYTQISTVDVYLICVSTSLKGYVPDLSAIFEVTKKVQRLILRH